MNFNDSIHMFNMRRHMGDFNLTILPQSAIRFRLGYSRLQNDGPSYSSFHEGTDIQLFQDFSDRQDQYYSSDEAFLYAVADALHEEYAAIVDAGFILQIDDAYLATYYDVIVPPGTLADFRRWAELRFDIRRWTDMPRGGPFAALEEPEPLTDDVRSFFRLAARQVVQVEARRDAGPETPGDRRGDAHVAGIRDGRGSSTSHP